jgi:glycerol uptake facilitator protein
MMFGEYFPDPAAVGTSDVAFAQVSHLQAMLAEFVGTALLVFFIFALTDPRNEGRPGNTLFTPFIGLAVAFIIAVIAPLTQAGLNPARDFGPRLFSFFAGWGEVAIPGPRGGFFTVYILAPLSGGCAGGAVYQAVLAARTATPGVPASALDEPLIEQPAEPS